MVVIDAYRGGDDVGYVNDYITEKDFNLEISKYINDRLKELGINTFLTRKNDINLDIIDRSNLIKNAFGNNKNIIAISNRLNYGNEEGVELLYSLKNTNSLSNKLEESFKNEGIKVNKINQKRDENDTSMDYDDLQKNTGLVETIIINYGYINNNNDMNNLKNKFNNYGEAVVKGIANYLGIPYSISSNKYIVQKGDSLYSISKKYNTTVDNLKELNKLKSNFLQIGDVLTIPSNSNVYVVKKGDTLYSISKKTNTPVEKIKELNKLNNNIIVIGQNLLINDNNNKYVVQKGDTLYSIAKKYNVTVDFIKNKNNLNNNLLQIGQILIIQ